MSKLLELYGMAWAKTTEHGRMTGRPWRKLRDAVMLRDAYLCRTCRARGLLVLATEVDHVMPLFKGGTNDPDNLAAICGPCHKAKTAADAGGRLKGCDANGNPFGRGDW